MRGTRRTFGARRAIVRRSRSATWQVAVAVLVATIGAAGLGYLAVQLFYLPETVAQSRLNLVPALVGMDIEDARGRGEADGYAVATAGRYSEEVEEGRVIYQVPPPQFYLPRGDTLHVLVSRGPVRTLVPDLTGLDPELARSILRQLRLQMTPPRRAPSDLHPQGMIVETIPPAGTAVQRDTRVTLVLSRGGSILAMPDVRGLALAEARDTLEVYALTVGEVTTLAKPEVDVEGRVIVVTGQDPPAGRNVRSGTAIRLELGEKAETTPPKAESAEREP